jgi:signal transduction histidine kinase/DNA-binding response OmpR family regulator
MVLIVDDKAENIFSLRRTLELNDFEVDSAGSGVEALRKILKHDYSLIILDVQMPGMDGFEVAEAISGYSKARDIPIIFLSAVNTDKKFITRGYTSGGIDYVTKPVDPDVFMLKVKTLNRLYEQNRELERTRLNLLEEISVRKKAEAELNTRVHELRSTLEAMPQITFTLTPNGMLEFANEHWSAYARKNSNMPEVHPEDLHVLGRLQECLAAGDSLVAEVRIKNILTDSFRYHLLRISPIRQGKTILKWVGTFTDIQEQKSVNEMLEYKVRERTEEVLQKNKALEASNYELQQFASVASHDLKEPLRKIQVFSSIIKDRFLQDRPDALDSINRISQVARKMSTLITDLIDYSRLSVDTLLQPVDFKRIITEIVHDFELTIEETGAVITVSDMPVIDAIPGQIRQVFQNLIGNSLKFVRPGVPPFIDISSEVITGPAGEGCRIVITDNGIGFNEVYLDRIFTIFQRLNSQEAFEGTGIGLAIVKKIIEKHQGSISAKSREGEGATFIITLPLHQGLSERSLRPLDTLAQ